MSSNEKKKGRMAIERRNTLLIYLLAVFIGVPVWWRLTDIYRADLPFHELAGLDEAAAKFPILNVGVVFSQTLGINAEDKHAVASWLESQMLRFLRPLDQVNVSVKHLDIALDDSTAPSADDSHGDAFSALEFDQYLDSILKQEEQCRKFDVIVFLIPTNRRALSDAHLLVMGRQQHGWVFLPSSNVHDYGTAINSLSFLPQALCGVLLGETEAPTSLMIYDEPPSADGGDQGGGLLGVSRAVPPQGRSGRAPRRVDAAAALALPRRIRVTLSLLVGGGVSGGGLRWEVAQAVESYVRPFLERIRLAYDVVVDSQVLHYAGLSVAPTYVSGLQLKKTRTRARAVKDALCEQAYTLASSTLNDFINSKDWVLDVTADSTRTFHLLLYIPAPEHAPLRILDSQGIPLDPAAFLIAGWGGVYVMDPPEGLYQPGPGPVRRIRVQDLQAPMESWVAHLRRLLGIDPGPNPLRVRQLVDPATGITDWQVRVLERSAALSRIRSTRHTIESLQALVERGEQLLAAQAAWTDGDFAAAVVNASSAQEYGESGFFEETMLSMLYFPDDHKMAVYVPFFVPVLLPVLVAVLREGAAIFGRRSPAAPPPAAVGSAAADTAVAGGPGTHAVESASPDAKSE